MNKIIDGKTYSHSKGSIYLIDCNVWMFIYYTFGNYIPKKVKNYSDLVSDIVKDKSKIIFPDILVSEFCNTYLKSEWKRYNTLTGITSDYKRDFRKLQEYKDAVEEIKDILKVEISSLNNIQFMDSKIDIPDFNSFFDNSTEFDFNDKYYAELAKKEGAIIITDDADFGVFDGINVITFNQRLLNIANGIA